MENRAFENDHNDPTENTSTRTSSMTQDENQITFSWSNLNVVAKQEKKDKSKFNSHPENGRQQQESSTKKVILQNVSGYVKPGELVAIMGASGAGKSTLLNTLTFRNLKGLQVTKGSIYANGVLVSPNSLTSVSAYVQQDDLFISTLTVRETLQFQALVRMDSHIKKSDRMKYVENIIIELGLSKCANSLIGCPGESKSISGGELKRLSFACEVLTNPSLFFCDEPTSGLDSYMAQNVVQVLRTLAEKGKTIICTIHQPSSQVYALFDRVLLMAEGRLAYLGDLPHAKQFFSKNGYPCPENYNPADHYIHVLAITPGKEESCRNRVKIICNEFENSQEGKSVIEVVNDQITNPQYTENLLTKEDLAKRSPYKASWIQQFRAVVWRSFLANIRDIRLVYVRIFQTILVSTLLGALYFNQDYDSQEGIMNLNGAMFLMMSNLTFANMFAVIEVFSLELPIFLREHFNGMYRTEIYYIAKQLADVPVFFMVAAIFVTIYYWMIGLYPDIDRFFIALIGMVCLTQTVISLGYVVSCISSSLQIAIAMVPNILIPLMIFGGFYLNTSTVPKALSWIQYLSWYHYGNELLISNQWHDLNITCDNSQSMCNFQTGEDVIAFYGFEEGRILYDLTMLIALSLVFRIMGFFGLLMKTFRK